jgi:hypothetical protein
MVHPPLFRRWTLWLGAAAIVLFATTGLLLVRQAGNTCRSWEGQLAELNQAMTRHRLSEGDRRGAALQQLKQLDLPCDEVDRVRDDCLTAYRHLYDAEKRHHVAKGALQSIEKAIGSLAEPWRALAESKYLEGHNNATIALEQQLTPEEVQRQLDEALVKLGTQRMAQLHQVFQEAHKTSAQHVASARTFNDRCDRGYKVLLERSQNN